MDLCFTLKILLVFSFELREIFPIQVINLENDITKHLDKWILSVLTFAIDNQKLKNILGHMMNRNDKFKNFDYSSKPAVNRTIERLEWNVLYEYEFDTDSSTSDRRNMSSSAEVDFKFSSNNARLFYKEIVHHAFGGFQVKYEGYPSNLFGFGAYLHINNVCFICNFTMLESSSSLNETNSTKISHNFSYSNLETSVFPGWASDSITQVSDTEKEELKQKVFPSILHECLNNNPNFTPSFIEIFQPLIQPKIELLSKYSNLQSNAGCFHYLIPRSPFLRFTLKRIVINGLSNLDSFKIRESTHTLRINNINGSMTLDYDVQYEVPFEMKFYIDHLFLMKTEKTDCIRVQAKYGLVTRATGKKLKYRKSEVMLNGLELAIASSIAASMKDANVCDRETILEEIQISNTSTWKTIKESYRKYIPFYEDF